MAIVSFSKITRTLVVGSLIGSALVSSLSGVASASVSVTPKVAIGQQHALALGSNGTVWTWGSLIPGPTGVGSKDSLPGPTQVSLPSSRTAVSIAATYNASFAVADDGTAWAWGSLGRGLGDAAVTTDSRYTTPVQISLPAGVRLAEVAAACEGVLARADNGDVYQWGSFYGNWSMSYSVPTKVNGISNATSISRGCNASFAITSSGSAFAWGANGGGRLGDGTTTDRPSPVSISLPGGRRFTRIATSSTHSVAVASDGTVWAWGGNSQGQLGADPNAVSFSSTPRQVGLGSATGVGVAVSDSTPFSTVVTNSGIALKWGGWGNNEYVPAPVSLPTSDLGSRKLIDVTTYSNAALFVADDNSVWAKGNWGVVDIDGNCGATASDYPYWKDGTTYPARPLVRVLSSGQFGTSFAEDAISLAKLETASGASLPLDGSGTAPASVGSAVSFVATAPNSSCYGPGRLSYSFSDNNGTSWVSSGITTSTNAYSQTVVNIEYTPSTSGRKKAQFKISNPDGFSMVYRFTVGVAATSSGAPVSSPSALPIVSSLGETAISIGTDGYLYGWGANTLITGGDAEVKNPRRITPAVDTSATFRSATIVGRGFNNSTPVALAASTNGKLYAWGTGSSDLMTGGTTDVLAPTEIPMPSGKKASKVFGMGVSYCVPGCQSPTPAAIGVVVDEAGTAYLWGGGPSTVTQYGYGSQPLLSSASSLAGISIANLAYAAGRILLRTPSGDAYFWSPNKTCSPSCSVAAPSLIALPNPLGERFSYGYLGSSGGSSQGLYDISGSGQLRFTAVDSSGAVGSVTNVALAGNRTVVDVSSNGGAVRVVAADGTLWNVYSTQWGPYKEYVPIEMLPISRSASVSGGFFVGAGGSLWSSNGMPAGTCAAIHSDLYGTANYFHVFSIGQFGAAYSEDAFQVALDSPANPGFQNFAKYGDQYGIYAPQPTREGNSELTIRPGSTVSLYAYFQSACNGDSGLSVAWDLNDDGEFETQGTVATPINNTTMLTTAREATPGHDAFDGLPSGFMQSKVDVSQSSPGGAFNQGGGRFISVRMTSAAGSATQRFAILTRPEKPQGRVGITINNSARFTDTSDVSVSLVWPEGSTTVLLSNDGSFSDVQEVPVAPTIRWKLPSDGSGLLPTTVYARFKQLGTDGYGSWLPGETEINYTDDIVLDLSPPVVAALSATTANTVSSQSVRSSGVARATSVQTQTALVSMSAFDAASGIEAVQVTTDPAVPGPARAYARSFRVAADRGTIAVRAKDNVGHWSEWMYAQISGFEASVPSNPATPSAPSQTPSAPTPAVPSVPSVTPPAVATPSVMPSPAVASPAVVSAVPVAKAVLSGANAKVSVSVPSSLAKTCKTAVVKGKKTTTCTAVPIVVSVSGGSSKTVSAKAGSNSIVLPAKKGQTVTVKVNGKVVQKIKM
jgi:alpha-tubulin suppressor-like RCC1 family protein